MAAQTSRWATSPTADLPAALAKLRVFPAGRALDRGLTDQLTADLGKPVTGFVYPYQRLSNAAVGIYIDLNGDKSDEFVFLTAQRGIVYENQAGAWVLVGNILPKAMGPPMADFASAIAGELTQGHVSAIAPKWNELSIGGRVFLVNPRD
jgi:hypothetical protein